MVGSRKIYIEALWWASWDLQGPAKPTLRHRKLKSNCEVKDKLLIKLWAQDRLFGSVVTSIGLWLWSPPLSSELHSLALSISYAQHNPTLESHANILISGIWASHTINWAFYCLEWLTESNPQGSIGSVRWVWWNHSQSARLELVQKTCELEGSCEPSPGGPEVKHPEVLVRIQDLYFSVILWAHPGG
jgi:hypothetical protein